MSFFEPISNSSEAPRGSGLSGGQIIEAAMISASADFPGTWADLSGIMAAQGEGSA